ncbi:MAG: M15 family metallopeptidase [Ignavibacteriaceae bacterium]|nr:M15 family metallopeptidase [Ignavibacteriaceae bacterium]
MKKLLFIFLVLFVAAHAQEISKNKYGLKVVENIELYKQLTADDSSKVLVDIEDFIPGIRLDIRYATDNNFTGKKVYTLPKAFVRLPVAAALKEIQNELKQQGLELKIFDAYRPYDATVLFYNIYHDTNFVASVWTGSRHNRGCAVDLTIINSASGEELNMPTPYDDFTEKANPAYADLPENVLQNRALLINTMEKHGFKVINSEWWHFDYNGWKDYELMNIGFEELF